MNAKPDDKLSAQLVPFHLLDSFHQKKWIASQRERLLDTLCLGYRIITVDRTKLGLLKQQLAPSISPDSIAALPSHRHALAAGAINTTRTYCFT